MSSPDVIDVFRLAGTTLEGRFEVDRVVAEGGFGVVYHAKQAALERPIALKVLKTPPRFDVAARQQFLGGFAAEAKTIARIAHPNIVNVHDFGVSDMPSGVRAAWMALEWLTGTTFEDELRVRRGRGGRSPAECLAILKPVLSALAIVHASGVAHRDLKPANIMLVPSPVGVTPKLLDFGIAKIMIDDEAPGTGNTQTRSTQTAFSPGYAAPEQISNGRSGPWTDVHAMGLILTEMLTDRAPIEGRETELLFQQIVDRVRPTPGKFGVEVGAWEAVLCRALAVTPAERYRDAAALLQALEAAVAEASAAFAVHGGEALGSMSTQPAPLESAPTPLRSNVTTHGATSQVHPAPPEGTWRRWAYVGGGVLALTIIGSVWRGIAENRALDLAAKGRASLDPPKGPDTKPAASSASAPLAAGAWEPPPDGLLHWWSSAEEHGAPQGDLGRYCGPFMKKLGPNWLDWKNVPVAGVTAEQTAFCTSVPVGQYVGAFAQWPTEARDAIGQIAGDVAKSFEARAKHGHASLCPSAGPLPKELQPPGVPYMPTPSDWADDPGWSCVHFSLERPMYFQYRIEVAGSKLRISAHGQRLLNGRVIDATISIGGQAKGADLDIGAWLDEDWHLVDK